MKIKTIKLTGNQLNWAVATCLFDQAILCNSNDKTKAITIDAYAGIKEELIETNGWIENYSPSTNWAHGGEIVEKNLIITSPHPSKKWVARSYMDLTEFEGDTLLIAAMRCFVQSQLGDEIEVPDELMSETEALA